jgi:hypothetical protein
VRAAQAGAWPGARTSSNSESESQSEVLDVPGPLAS